MNYLDVIILAVFGFFVLRGLWKGFFQEVFGLVGLIAGLLVATKYMSNISKLILSAVDIPPTMATILGFLLLFFAVIFSFQVLIHISQKIAKVSSLGWVEKGLGGVFGGLKAGIMISLVIILISAIPFANQMIPDRENSVLYEPTRRFAPTVFDYIVKLAPHSKTFYSELRESVEGFSFSALSQNTQEFIESFRNIDQPAETQSDNEATR